MQALPPSRRAALRAYLIEVARDLAMRGVIRWKKGQSIDTILKAEGDTILREVGSDVAVIAAEIGIEVGVKLMGGLQNLGLKWITEKLAAKR